VNIATCDSKGFRVLPYRIEPKIERGLAGKKWIGQDSMKRSGSIRENPSYPVFIRVPIFGADTDPPACGSPAIWFASFSFLAKAALGLEPA
jgi:hypothetical protein